MPLDFKAPCKHTFSANEIRTASECARKRYYASRDCLAIRANKPSKALLLGGAIHTCLQYYYTELDKKIKEVGLAKPSLEDCQDLLDTIPQLALEGYDLLDKDSQKIYDLVSEMYKEQVAVDLVSYEVINCELAFHMDDWPIADCMYHGFVDMVVKGREDGKIYFFEHKTCTNFRPEIYDRFDIQLHIYAEYGKRYCNAEGCNFGGMILNQIKKAKTERGYDTKRDLISYNDKELEDFYIWLKQKTEAVISPDNHHSPCNNYMTCKMCEYAPICLKYGYEVPQTAEEIINSFNEVVGQEADGTEIIQPVYKYDPRPDEEEETKMATKLSFSELLKRAQKFEKIAIHTPTEEQAKTLLTELDEIGYRWANGEKLTTKTRYKVEKEITCYNFEPNKKIMYSPLDYYQKNNYTIIEFSDIDFKE